MARRLIPLVVLIVLGGQSVRAQDSTRAVPDTARAWQETAWSRIVVRNGLEISYIFYSEADNRNDGIVLRLRNRNDYAVRYAFTLIFRGPEDRASTRVEGTLTPREMKTGEKGGLFWVPFEGRRRIGEVGLRDLTVKPVRPDRSLEG